MCAGQSAGELNSFTKWQHSMKIVEFTSESLYFREDLPSAIAGEGFIWIFLDRTELPAHWPLLQQAAQNLGGSQLLDLHCNDLANATHPSRYDYTTIYDLIIFRRLATPQEAACYSNNGNENENDLEAVDCPPPTEAEQALKTEFSGSAFDGIRSLPVGFAVFDRLLISIHPPGCSTASTILQRFLEDVRLSGDTGYVRTRLPMTPADLSLRMINGMVDSYLAIRKDLSAQLKKWQADLLKTSAPFHDWDALMLARSQLHLLEDLCDEQHDALQEWLDGLLEQPLETFHADAVHARLRRDHVTARARDVIEHIDRVRTHAQRLEQTAETAVQIHFSAQGNRTNDIMRVLTVLTAIFLPLNLITGIFGMNFRDMPLLEHNVGFWITIGSMVLIAVGLSIWFWRKRYLEAQ